MFEVVTNKHLEDLKTAIQETIASKGLDNTGSAFDSLEVKGNALLGNDYIFYLDQGRGPGKFPPPENIAEWVRNKLGLEGKEAKQAAFLIGRKISQEGTSIFKDKSKGLQLDFLIENMLTSLEQAVANEAKVEVLKWL